MASFAPPPLKGLKVLSVEQYGAGPFATQYLSTFGADVIKIESRQHGGDVARVSGPYRLGDEDSLYFQAFNQGKRSLALDLKSPKGQDVLRRLVARVDVMANNLRGDQAEKLGLTFDALRAANPRIVCVHLSAYGRDNERASWPGYDYLMQAEAGFMDLTGDPTGEPQRAGLSLVDFMTGMNQAFAIMVGVHFAREAGEGSEFDVSLFDTALYQLSYPALWHLNHGYALTRQPRSSHPDATPSQTVKTKDGWLFIMCQTEKFWRILNAEVSMPEVSDNPDYRTMRDRRAHRDQLSAQLDEIFASRTTKQWLAALRGKVPVSSVATMAEALANPFVERSEMIQEVDHPKHAAMKVLANPIRLHGKRMASRPGPNRIGEHSEAVLREFEFSDDEIRSLAEDGVI